MSHAAPPASSRTGAQFTQLALHVIRLATLLEREGAELARPHVRSPARWRVLSALRTAPQTVPHIARRHNLKRQSVQRLVDRMMEDGLVQRTENPDHRRSVLIELTGAGRDVLARVDRAKAEWAGRVAAGLTPAALRTATETVRDIAEKLSGEQE